MSLVIHESIYNETSNHSLLSEFQLREFRIIIDSIFHRHVGTQQMIVKDNNDSDVLTIALDLDGCMIHFRHRLLTTDEIETRKQYCSTQGMPHGIRYHSLIKLQISFINKSLIQKITILVLHIFQIPVLLRLTKIIQICPSMIHQIYLQITSRVNRHI
jgi:hypothetical protein